LRTIALSKNRDRLRLLILAGGSFDPYESLLDELGLRDRVIVRQNLAAVEEYLEAADAGLYTSEYESFGLGILETLFYGRPVVAFRVGGIPEVVARLLRRLQLVGCQSSTAGSCFRPLLCQPVKVFRQGPDRVGFETSGVRSANACLLCDSIAW